MHLKVSKLACYWSMDAGRKHDTPGQNQRTSVLKQSNSQSFTLVCASSPCAPRPTGVVQVGTSGCVCMHWVALHRRKSELRESQMEANRLFVWGRCYFIASLFGEHLKAGSADVPLILSLQKNVMCFLLSYLVLLLSPRLLQYFTQGLFQPATIFY